MTKADEIKIRKIIQEELRDFFAKTVGLIPIENDNKKSGIKKPENNGAKAKPKKNKRKTNE